MAVTLDAWIEELEEKCAAATDQSVDDVEQLNRQAELGSTALPTAIRMLRAVLGEHVHVREQHICATCMTAWPCETVRAIAAVLEASRAL